MKGRYVLLSLVMLVVGFLISFSYQLTSEKPNNNVASSAQWKREFELKEKLIVQEERNRDLQQELYRNQEKVREYEENLKNEKRIFYNLVEDVERFRMYVGEVGVHGQGIEVTLKDASYIPDTENVNNYIVHENHIFKVVNELLISGASAISINGQRLSHDSYIYCNGPVITVDGNQYPAPFVISAIGDTNVLKPALNIAGGVVEQLVYDNIEVIVEEKSDIKMDPLLQENKNP
ncbi:DUF881 domain-containing protein [Metabacillus arenae]|uniref:DUF881 domain-containing protein n=1 Tax=Metabacillus arenae TaxID=2771434 RepID=A0A926RWI3_9BACI|nr:DUF881 domain-containing protein [Metabacillus arenae]MBD1379936.1 DUF881 domain-containing protein [Metabacillus arenae]